LKPSGFLVLSTPDRTRTALFAGTNPYHRGERTPEELSALLREYFPRVELAYQEIVPASVIWHPEHPASRVPLWAFRAGQTPEPVAVDTHLPLIGVAGPHDLAVDLQSVAVDNARRLLLRLWQTIDTQTRQLMEYDARETALREQVAFLQAQYDALWHDNRVLADQVRDWASVLAERDALRAEREHLQEAAMQWAIVSQSRAWHLVRRYWYWLDHAPFRRVLWWIRGKILKRMSDA